MSTQKIAQFMVERRSRAVPVVTTGEVLSDIGSEGLQEALTRRWLVVSPDMGLLQINTDMARVQEMVEAAGTPDKVVPTNECESTGYSVAHALGHTQRINEGWLHEIGAPGTGKPGPTMGAPTPTAPIAPPAPRPSGAIEQSAEPTVGADVTVVEDGKTYTGKVAARSPRGQYKLSFDANNRPPVTREYAPDEMQLSGR